MSFEFKDVNENDFPVVSVRTSVYKQVVNDFIESQLQRGSVDLSGLSATQKQIQSGLRRVAKDRNLEITVNDKKIAFIKKI